MNLGLDSNPICTCAQRTSYKCAWCPGKGYPGSQAEEIKCQCQLHWILYPQLYQIPYQIQSEAGLGICFKCVSRRTTLHHLQSCLHRLDASARLSRGQLEACVHGSATQEVEVQGNLALSFSVDDRAGVRVWVQLGRCSIPSTNIGRGDTTTVEYRVTPYYVDSQRYIDDGLRAASGTFDWDRPDTYNADPDTQMVDEEDGYGSDV
jgi:hypothetical protein